MPAVSHGDVCKERGKGWIHELELFARNGFQEPVAHRIQAGAFREQVDLGAGTGP